MKIAEIKHADTGNKHHYRGGELRWPAAPHALHADQRGDQQEPADRQRAAVRAATTVPSL